MTESTPEKDVSSSSYTSTILRAIGSNLDSREFIYYLNTIRRVLRGEISPAASSPALQDSLMRRPKAIFLHNEVVAMTHDTILMRNIPKVHDASCDRDPDRFTEGLDNYAMQLLDLVDRFALTEGARPVDAKTARHQVMQCLDAVLERHWEAARVAGDLAAALATMGV